MKFAELKSGERRAAFFSDAHMYESKDPLHKNLEGENTAGEKIIASAIKEGERRFVLTLKRAHEIGNLDFIFFGGDMVTGYGERGLIGPDSPEHIAKFKEVLYKHFQDLPKWYMAGGHEIGYILPLSTDPKGGPSEKSIEVFEENFNQLFYTFSESRYKFVVLSSDLELLKGGSDVLMKRKALQEEFYKDEITYADPGQKIVLMLHDPDALASMFSFLGKNLGKIERTFAGHQHAWMVSRIVFPLLGRATSNECLERFLLPQLKKLERDGWLAGRGKRVMYPGQANKVWKYFKNAYRREYTKVWKEMKLCIIPAPGGMLGIGGGFLIVDLKEEGIKVNKVKAK